MVVAENWAGIFICIIINKFILLQMLKFVMVSNRKIQEVSNRILAAKIFFLVCKLIIQNVEPDGVLDKKIMNCLIIKLNLETNKLKTQTENT